MATITNNVYINANDIVCRKICSMTDEALIDIIEEAKAARDNGMKIAVSIDEKCDKQCNS